jgi:hypothetical protein
MPVLSYVPSSSTLTSVRPPSIRSGGQTGRCHGRPARATTLAAGARTSIDLDANAPGVTAASAPSMTAPRPCSTRPSAHCRTGCSRRFGSVSPARHGALPEKWASTSGPAIAGAGGCAMPHCPTRCIANWKGRWKPMISITGIGKSNGLFYRPLLPPPATRPHRRPQAGRVGGRAPAPGGAGLRLPGGG